MNDMKNGRKTMDVKRNKKKERKSYTAVAVMMAAAAVVSVAQYQIVFSFFSLRLRFSPANWPVVVVVGKTLIFRSNSIHSLCMRILRFFLCERHKKNLSSKSRRTHSNHENISLLNTNHVVVYCFFPPLVPKQWQHHQQQTN